MKYKNYIILSIIFLYCIGLLIQIDIICYVLNGILLIYVAYLFLFSFIKNKLLIIANAGLALGFIYLIIFILYFWINDLSFLTIYKQLVFVSLIIIIKELLESIFKISNPLIKSNKKDFLYQNLTINRVVLGFTFLITGYVVLSIYFFNTMYNYETIAIIFLVTFPFIDKYFFNVISTFLRNNLKEKGVCITPEALQKLSKIRTIAFDKNGVISDGNYKIIALNHRKTIRKSTVLQLFGAITHLWNNSLYKIVQVSDKSKSLDNKLKIITNSFVEISVEDDHKKTFSLTTESKERNTIDDYNLFLFKNNIQIAKFLVTDTVLNYSGKLLEQINERGFNTVLFCQENGRTCKKVVEKIGFDRVYPNLDDYKKVNLINKLQKKAPVMYVTNVLTLKSNVEINCLISAQKINNNFVHVIVSEPLSILQLLKFWKYFSSFLSKIFFIVILYHIVFYSLIISNLLQFKLILILSIIISMLIKKIVAIRINLNYS